MNLTRNTDRDPIALRVQNPDVGAVDRSTDRKRLVEESGLQVRGVHRQAGREGRILGGTVAVDDLDLWIEGEQALHMIARDDIASGQQLLDPLEQRRLLV